MRSSSRARRHCDGEVEDRRIDQPQHIDRRGPRIAASEGEQVAKRRTTFGRVFALGSDAERLTSILLMELDHDTVLHRTIVAGDEKVGLPSGFPCLGRRDIEPDPSGQSHAPGFVGDRSGEARNLGLDDMGGGLSGSGQGRAPVDQYGR